MIYDSGIVKGEEKSKAIFDGFLGKVAFLRVYGVAVLDLPYVASGRADILVSNIPKPMDIAAGALLVEEAGGRVSDFEGNSWSLEMRTVIVSNGKNHEEALKVIQEKS